MRADCPAGRKIGCDRQQPACGNCVRTKRSCLGYGVRLAWPDKHDGRRKTPEVPLSDIYLLPHSVTSVGWHFLNFTVDDITSTASGLDVLITTPRPRPVSWLPDLEGEPGQLMAYCEPGRSPSQEFTCLGCINADGFGQMRTGYRA